MKRIGTILKGIFWFVTMLAMFLSLSVATYAWFTSNKVVDTNSVSGRSGSETLALQISASGGDTFQGMDEAAIVQVNQTETTQLYPVSTADLKTFVYSTGTTGDIAAAFRVVENEKYYYHGRIYIRAQAQGQSDNAKVALYLDEGSAAGGTIVQNAAGDLLNAARLGLKFDSGQSFIFSLSDSRNAVNDQIYNTQVDGVLLGDDQVLAYADGQVQAVDDPAETPVQYTITLSDDSVSLPDAPLLYMALNRIYAVDIYFYLEGCDPDCSESISFDSTDLHLAFYGILTE